MIRFLTDALKALNVLEKNSFVHGSIRPESFFYYEKKQSYVLIDRIFDAGIYYQNVLIDFILNGDHLYISPELFRAILNKKQIKESSYQQDTFALGLVVAAILLDEETIQRVFDVQNHDFDLEFLENIKVNISQLYKGQYKLLGDFICQVLLNETCERDRPGEALLIFKRLKMEFEDNKINSISLSEKAIVADKQTQQKKDSSFKQNTTGSKQLNLIDMSLATEKLIRQGESIRREQSANNSNEEEQEKTEDEGKSQTKSRQISHANTDKIDSNFSFNFEDSDMNGEQDEVFNKILKNSKRQSSQYNNIQLNQEIVDIVNNDEILNTVDSQKLIQPQFSQQEIERRKEQEQQQQEKILFEQDFKQKRPTAQFNYIDQLDFQEKSKKSSYQNQDQDHHKDLQNFDNNKEQQNRLSFGDMQLITSFAKNDHSKKSQEDLNQIQNEEIKNSSKKIHLEVEQDKSLVQTGNFGNELQTQEFGGNSTQLKQSNDPGQFQMIYDDSIQSLVKLGNKNSQVSIGSELFKKNLDKTESNAMFTLIESEEFTQKRNSMDDFMEIHPGKFAKNLNDNEDIDYLADSENIDDDQNIHPYSHFAEKSWFFLERVLNFQKFEKFCLEKEKLIPSEEQFSLDKEQFLILKDDLLMKLERNQKKMMENNIDFNRDLFRLIVHQKDFSNIFYKFLEAKFLFYIQEEKKQMISQADLIEFDMLNKEYISNYDDFEDFNIVEKKYSDIGQVNRKNSFDEKIDNPYIPLDNQEIDKIVLSQRGIQKLKVFMESNKDRINTDPPKQFENLYSSQIDGLKTKSERVILNRKFSSIRNIDQLDKKHSLVTGKEFKKDINELKQKNQNSFNQYAFVPFQNIKDDFKKPFHSEKEIQKVKITFAPVEKKEQIKKKEKKISSKKKLDKVIKETKESQNQKEQLEQLKLIFKENKIDYESKDFHKSQFVSVQTILNLITKINKNNKVASVKKESKNQKQSKAKNNKQSKKKHLIRNVYKIQLQKKKKFIKNSIKEADIKLNKKQNQSKHQLQIQKILSHMYQRTSQITQQEEQHKYTTYYQQTDKKLDLTQSRNIIINLKSRKPTRTLKTQTISLQIDQIEKGVQIVMKQQDQGNQVELMEEQNQQLQKMSIPAELLKDNKIMDTSLRDNIQHQIFTKGDGSKYFQSVKEYIDKVKLKKLEIETFCQYFKKMKIIPQPINTFKKSIIISKSPIRNTRDVNFQQIHNTFKSQQFKFSEPAPTFEESIDEGRKINYDFIQSQLTNTISVEHPSKVKESPLPLKITQSKFKKDIEVPIQQMKYISIKDQITKNDEQRRFGSKSPVRIKRYTEEEFKKLNPIDQTNFLKTEQPKFVNRQQISEVFNKIEKQSYTPRQSYIENNIKSDIDSDLKQQKYSLQRNTQNQQQRQSRSVVRKIKIDGNIFEQKLDQVIQNQFINNNYFSYQQLLNFFYLQK